MLEIHFIPNLPEKTYNFNTIVVQMELIKLHSYGVHPVAWRIHPHAMPRLDN
jgi:hypothetical protein